MFNILKRHELYTATIIAMSLTITLSNKHPNGYFLLFESIALLQFFIDKIAPPLSTYLKSWFVTDNTDHKEQLSIRNMIIIYIIDYIILALSVLVALPFIILSCVLMLDPISQMIFGLSIVFYK